MSSGCGDVLSLEDLKTAKKHQVFEAEVITGRAGGVSGGAEIDTATNPVTGQVQKTTPAILRDIGFSAASFDFTTGGTLTVADRDAVVYNPADNNWYSWSGTLPHVVAAGTDPTADSNWRPRTDQLLRQELSRDASLVGTAQGGTVEDFISGYRSVAALRTFSGQKNGQRVFLRGLNEGSPAGKGYFIYDADDTTSVDNGWFIIVTHSGHRLKREGLYESIKLAQWSGVTSTDDITPFVQTAVDWIRSVAIAQGSTYGLPYIAFNSGVYLQEGQVKTTPYICFVCWGNVKILTSQLITRAELQSLYLVDASSDTVNFYNPSRGADFPVMFAGVSGKWKFMHGGPTETSVPLANRPSVFKFTSSNQNTHNNNMKILDVESGNLYTVLDIVAVNFWGVRVEDSVLGGYIGINFASGGSNSGERISVANSWIGGVLCAIYAGATNMQLNLDSCSSDFLGSYDSTSEAYTTPGDFIYKPGAGWFSVTANDCHIENFGGYLVRCNGGGNVFFTFKGTTILPDGRGIAPSPSRKLFDGAGNVLLDDCFVQFNQPMYDQCDGLCTPTSTMNITTRNMRNYDTRDMYYSNAAILSRYPTLSGNPVSATPVTTPTNFTTFRVDTISNMQASVEDTQNSLIDSGLSDGVTRTLKLQATANSAYATIKGTEFIPVSAGNWYATKVVAASSLLSGISGIFRMQIEWFDGDKVSMGSSSGWYDTFNSLATANVTGVPAYASRSNKRIANIYNPFQAPAGAQYCKMYYNVTNLNAGQIFYITQHLVYKSPKGA